jgi:hypothetical protein
MRKREHLIDTRWHNLFYAGLLVIILCIWGMGAVILYKIATDPKEFGSFFNKIEQGYKGEK